MKPDNDLDYDRAIAKVFAAELHDTARVLAVGLNAATNGRWFCALLVAVNIASGHHFIAALACLPVGLSALIDRADAGSRMQWPAHVVIMLSVGITALTLLSTWMS